jgi:hypothetical protein
LPLLQRDTMREVLADLPLVPDASSSAQLIGPREIALPCLAVLARHVVQGLRDFNLTLAHDRPRLRSDRRKLLFLDPEAFLGADQEAVVCIVDATPALIDRLTVREKRGLATFITATTPIMPWRTVRLRSTP